MSSSEVEGRLHQREVAERLREVAGHPSLDRVVLLRQQADVVDETDQSVEERDRSFEGRRVTLGG